MKTLEQIKDEYAKALHFNDWDDLTVQTSLRVGSSIGKITEIEKYQDKIAKLYAKEVAKEALKNAKEKMEYEYAGYEEMPDFGYIVDENNIPEL